MSTFGCALAGISPNSRVDGQDGTTGLPEAGVHTGSAPRGLFDCPFYRILPLESLPKSTCIGYFDRVFYHPYSVIMRGEYGSYKQRGFKHAPENLFLMQFIIDARRNRWFLIVPGPAMSPMSHFPLMKDILSG